MSQLNTIGKLLLRRKELSPQNLAYGYFKNQTIQSVNFKSYVDSIEMLAIGLARLGFKPGEKVSILSRTRLEWHLMDMAFLSSGLIVVPIYHSYTPDEILAIYDHSESHYLVIESIKQMSKISSRLKNKCQVIICLRNFTLEEREQFSEFNLMSFQEVVILGSENIELEKEKFRKQIQAQQSDSTATIIYTSGTTGEPKGAVISHQAIISMLFGIKKFVGNTFGETDRSLIFLPLSHVAGRTDSFLPLVFGWQMIFAQNMDKIIENLKSSRPTVMIGVPRIFEKIYSAAMLKIENEIFIKKNLYHWAYAVSKKYFAKIDQGLTPSTLEILQRKLAYELVFEKIFLTFGGSIRFFITGGAPIDKEVLTFLRFSNLTPLESYGLTETMGPCFLNPPHLQKIGSVGKPLNNTQIKIASDGEILLKTDSMFTEYFKNLNETQNVFEDGWFKTGDVGQIDQDGFLYITDRKKDLIITSAGKNIAPQKIENLLKTKSLIAHASVFGDRKKYLTALIGIEKASFLSVLEKLNLPEDCAVTDLAQHPKVKEMVAQQVNETNSQLASFETIKQFQILPLEISTQNYQTPSLKIKKKQLFSDFKDTIDKMY